MPYSAAAIARNPHRALPREVAPDVASEADRISSPGLLALESSVAALPAALSNNGTTTDE